MFTIPLILHPIGPSMVRTFQFINVIVLVATAAIIAVSALGISGTVEDLRVM